jgi:hypothetical protein
LQKIAYIFILVLFCSCSVSKRRNNDKLINQDIDLSANTIEKFRGFNISNESFFISKAEVIVISEEEKQTYLASVKYIFPDRYLISLRSKSGVEGARVYLTGDTILINDRINRKLFYGDPDYIRKKFGIAPDFLPLFLGDFIFNSIGDQDKVKCIDGFMKFSTASSGFKFDALVDCNKLKLITCVQKNDKEEEVVRIKYSKYNEIGDYIIPSKIELEFDKIKVFIAIRKVQLAWDGNFNFIPGSKYEVIPLK